MPTIDWILVADRSRARLLHVLPQGARPWPTLASFIHAAGKLNRQDRETDVPGRMQLPGGPRAAVEPHEDPEHAEARRFAAQLAAHLDRARQEGRFDRLIVVAAPMFLGVLRESWPPPLRSRIALEVDRNLAGLSDSVLQVRLSSLVAAASAVPPSGQNGSALRRSPESARR